MFNVFFMESVPSLKSPCFFLYYLLNELYYSNCFQGKHNKHTNLVQGLVNVLPMLHGPSLELVKSHFALWPAGALVGAVVRCHYV